jgi:prepilin-type N-terminal cleavage/methylation domain-containing protein
MMISKLSIRQRLASHEGFSLIEVLVAIGIFSVAILGLAVGAITITRANKTSQFHTVGTKLAQDKLEQLKASAFAAVGAGGDVPPPVQGVAFTRNWTVTNSTATFKQINVTVQWTDYFTHDVLISGAISQ